MKVKEGAYLEGFYYGKDSNPEAELDAMFDAFGVSAKERAELEDAELLFGDYYQADYEGSARVVYRLNGELYEVEGGHCSCNGLEEQWTPLKVNAEYLKNLKIYRHEYDENGRKAWEAMLADL